VTALPVLFVITIGAVRELSSANDNFTGTVSTADGTAAHLYAGANQCPPSADVIFWLNGRSIPNPLVSRSVLSETNRSMG
jgi:hypothetical protein